MLAGLAVILGGAPALADSPSELRARLEYSAPPSCPREGRFRTLLAQHSAVVIVRAAPLVLRVEVTRDQKRHRGRVMLLTNEEEGAREVVADRCEDVVRGLALFSAIALDAWLEQRPKEEPPPVSGEPPARAEPPPTPRPKRGRRRMAPKVVPVHLPSSPWGFSFGAALGQQAATRTRLVRHLAVIGDLELPWALRSSVRVQANMGAALPDRYYDGRLSFVMGWTRGDICPAWVAFGSAVRASVCPVGEIGFQRAALEGAAVGRSDIRLWVAAGGLGRVRARLGDKLEIAASAGTVVPLRPFDFRTLTGVAYSTPAVAPLVELDLLVRLF